jgi:5-methylcytosine-specific restriction endonuclease McrA
MNLISNPLTLKGKEVRMTSAKQSRSRMTGNYHVRFCMGVRGSDTPLDPTKWGRKCAYCHAENVPLEIEHIHPKSKGGSSRFSNLTIACNACNLAKGNQDIKDFLPQKPDVLNRILKQAKQPLKDAAAVNSTRWQLFNRLVMAYSSAVEQSRCSGQLKLSSSIV